MSLSTLTDERLREVALLADACLLIEAARLYGLITGGPNVKVDRCEEAIAAARERGLHWTDVERLSTARDLMLEVNGAPGVQPVESAGDCGERVPPTGGLAGYVCRGPVGHGGEHTPF